MISTRRLTGVGLASSVELVRSIRLVGDPILSSASRPVDPLSPSVIKARGELHAVLEAFRREKGFGRAIAAPQIGHSMRMVALNMGPERIYTMHNPELFNKSPETFTLW